MEIGHCHYTTSTVTAVHAAFGRVIVMEEAKKLCLEITLLSITRI